MPAAWTAPVGLPTKYMDAHTYIHTHTCTQAIISHANKNTQRAHSHRNTLMQAKLVKIAHSHERQPTHVHIYTQHVVP